MARERLATVDSKKANADIKRQGRAARALMARLGREADGIATSIAPLRSRTGSKPEAAETISGDLRPELRRALGDASLWVESWQLEVNSWRCGNPQHRELCASRAVFGPDIEEIATQLFEISGRSTYLLGPDMRYNRRQVDSEVRNIHDRFRRLGKLLSKSSTFDPVREVHPPRFERFRDGVTESDFMEDLQDLVDLGFSLRRSLAKSTLRLDKLSDWNNRVNALLARCLSREAARGFLRQTHGFDICRSLAMESHVLRAAYLELGLVYLEKVKERMPKYAEASGQRPQVSITINGGTFHGSQIAARIDNIASKITAVHQQGAPGMAGALTELTQAVSDLKGIDEQRRTELLDTVEYLAEAAEAPAEKRKSGLIKAAIGTLREAATA